MPRFLVTALTAAAVLLAAGCGSGAGPATAEPAASAPAKGGAFPVTIEHKHGVTTIPAEPQRIVTVGLTDQDAVLALGKVPVGTTEWFGGFPGAVGPWATAKLNGAPVPAVLTDTGTGPQVERIAALKPDLILALYSGMTKKEYDSLSKFAPVVAQPKEFDDFGIPWREQTEAIGRALGKQAEATKLVADLDAEFAALRKENPVLEGATAVVSTPYEGFFVYGSEDARSRTLTSLGMKLPADLDKVIGDKFGASISKERSDLLDQDVTVWTVPDLTKDPATLHKDAVYGDLDVVEQGREVFVGESTEYGTAFSFVTVLSLPYVLDRLVPQLVTALDGDPATAVRPVES